MATSEQMSHALRMLTSAISSEAVLPDTSFIRQIVDKAAPFLSSLYEFNQKDFEEAVRTLETRFVTTMGIGDVLTDTISVHNENWYRERAIAWNYAEDYRDYLMQNDWSPSVIHSLDTVTNTILGLLHDPTRDGEWERRGLVIGHVQSGKTANYLGLVSKAADAGYKFIIVIAGIHNELRSQTQERVDAGFIGRDSITNARIGVGQLNPNRAMPVTVTTRESDFNKTLARRVGMQLSSFQNTFILVIKKNASTLSSLYMWLKELNTRRDTERISDIPMLMIDDEADNASVNTSRSDLNPTRINRELRNILQLFRKKCYIGYTATPFANIFIDPDARDDTHGTDLFPEHFIYGLDAPTNYLGYQRIFLEEDGKSRFICITEDMDSWLPVDHAKITPVYELPESLRRSMRLFVLARAIRNLRGQEQQHCSMLVNVSRFVDVQKQVRSEIDRYLGNLKKAVAHNSGRIWTGNSSDPIISALFNDFQTEYHAADVVWTDVLRSLNQAVNAISVAVVNSRSDEKLLYSQYNQKHEPYTVIAIGGLSLSRGLTLEGLTISYIHRNTQMYDTLMQMGRWFGYHDQYADLCRVFMSEISYSWYAHISEATDELRDQIRRMRREGKQPGDFGLYVKAHPDALIVTALNKMYHTDLRSFQVSYDGKLVETFVLPVDAEVTKHNSQSFSELFEQLQHKSQPDWDKASFVFTDVPWNDVHSFLLQFRVHTELREEFEAVARYCTEIQEEYSAWDVAFFSPRKSPPAEGNLIGSQDRSVGHRTPSGESGFYTGNKNRFSGNSTFSVGLSATQIESALQLAKESDRKTPLFRDYTNARSKPLLVLHLIQFIDNQIPPKLPDDLSPLPAISVSFPNGKAVKTVDYVVGPVWLKQMESLAEYEDDFDAEQSLV